MDFDRILSELAVSREYVAEVLANLENNAIISEYYEKLYHKTNRDRYLALADEVYHCHDLFTCDQHPINKLIDVLRIRLCHNRFCTNCQKMIQASRLERFTPFLLDTSETKELYHMVFTVPNIPGVKLDTYISILFEAFSRLVRFIRGTDKLKGVDFSPLGYVAAIRSLEVTYNSKNRDYHPHLHCIFAFNKFLDMPKLHRNKFSYDYESGQRVYKRSFSDLEVFLQKLWRLLVDQITARIYKNGLTAKPIKPSEPVYKLFKNNPTFVKPSRKRADTVTLDYVRLIGDNDGYSVIVDPVSNDSFVQVFKYAFKLQSEDNKLMSFEQFEMLQEALRGRKTIQGYGAWYNLKVDDRIDESMDEFFDLFKAYLWQVDRPESVAYSPEQLLNVMDEGIYKVFTRRKIHRLLEDYKSSDLYNRRDELLESIPPKKTEFSMPDLGGAYYRYLHHRRTSDVFADVRKQEIADTGEKILVLNSAQLDFFNSIFV